VPSAARADDLPMTIFASVLVAAAVCSAIVIHQVQVRLEQWDYERHVDD
jgi:hypothetical protein